jgi:uncharacterized protein YcfJ
MLQSHHPQRGVAPQEICMKSTTTTILIATGALLFGGVATAAFMNSRGAPEPITALPTDGIPSDATATALDDAAAVDNQIQPSTLQYAEVVKVDPITSKEKLYATVIGSEPVRETTTTSAPREVCEDVVVEERLPERDGNAGGTVAGAVIGGLLGNQVGGGNGKKAATAAGAVVGGVIGNKVDKNHVGGKVVSRTERQCRTETASSESSRVTGYNVTYRNADGTTGTMRMDGKPGSRIAMGTSDKVIGYDVTYRYDGAEQTVRMDEKPMGRLPVIDGQVVIQTASAGAEPRG